jgi:hypothetical protein
MNLRTIKEIKEDIKPVFNPRNYRNSPIIREFYRFIAKNGLRAEALKMVENGKGKSKTSYLSKISLN